MHPKTLILCALMAATPLFAVTLTVPGDYATVQAAVNAATPGDVVLVSDGTYSSAAAININSMATPGNIEIRAVNARGATLTRSTAGSVVVAANFTGDITIAGFVLRDNVASAGAATEGVLDFENVSGTVRAIDCDFPAPTNNCISVFNTTAASTGVLVDGCSFTGLGNEDMVRIDAEGSGVLDLVVRDCTGSALMDDFIEINIEGTSEVRARVTDNNISSWVASGDGVDIFFGASGTTGVRGSVLVEGNTFTAVDGDGVNFQIHGTNSVATIVIENNTFAPVTDSGSADGISIMSQSTSNGATVSALISNNVVNGAGGAGIAIETESDPAGATTQSYFVVVDNQVSDASQIGTLASINFDFNDTADPDFVAHIDVRDNTVTNPTGDAYFIEQAGGAVQLHQGASTSTVPGTVLIDNNNLGTPKTITGTVSVSATAVPDNRIPFALGDLMFSDLNGDGIQNGGEVGVEGVSIALSGTAGVGGAVSATTISDADGNYAFPALLPPNASGYSINVTLPTGFTAFSPQNQGGDDTLDSDVGSTGIASGIAAPAARTFANLTVDAGLVSVVAVSFTAPADLCLNAGVQSGLGGGTPTGGVYSGTGVTDDGNGMTYSFDPAAAGVGTHTLTYTMGGSASDDIEVFALPSASFTALADLCLNAGVQSGLGGGTPTGGVYSGTGVTDDGNGMTYSFDPAAAGVATHTITYTFTDSDGCTDAASDDVEVFAVPTANFTAPADLCINAGVQAGLGGGTPTGGVYSGPGVTDDGNGMTYSFDPAAAGVGVHTLNYTITDNDGCTDVDSDAVEVFALPTVNFTAPADMCLNAGVQTGLGGGTPIGGVYSGTGVTDDGNGMTYSFDPAAAGVATHSLTYTFTDSDGCTDAASDDVEVFALPTAGFTALADLCLNAGVQAGLGGGTPTGGVYSGTGVTDDGNGMTYSFDPAAAGVATHTITYTFTDSDGCTDAASDDVEVFALPTASFTAPADLCINAGVQAGLGGGTPTGGVYSGPGVTDDGNGMTYSFDPAAAGVGVHTLSYTITDNDGCTDVDSDAVEVFALPVVNFTALADECLDAGVQAGLGGGTPIGGVYSGTGVTDEGNGITYSFDPAAAGVGTHTLSYTYTDANGCTNTASDDVEVLALPAVSFTAPADLCVDDGVQTGLGTGTPIGGVYSGTGVTDDGNGMTYSFDPAAAGIGTHSLDYTYADTHGCIGTASDDVEVVPQNCDGGLIAATSVTEPVDILTSFDSAGSARPVFDFAIQDGGGGDGLPLNVSQIVINTSGTALASSYASKITFNLTGAGANVTGSWSGTTLTFTGLSISVADGGSEDFVVEAWFNDNTGVTDGQTVILTIDGDADLTVDAANTRMGTTSPVNNGTGSLLVVIETELEVSGADLVISDANGGATDDNLTISFDGTDFTILENNGGILAYGASSGTSISVPAADFSGAIIVNGLAGDDQLTVDNSATAIGRNLTFNGGANTAVGDRLTLAGGSFPTVTFNATNPNDGSIELGGSTITYTGLE